MPLSSALRNGCWDPVLLRRSPSRLRTCISPVVAVSTEAGQPPLGEDCHAMTNVYARLLEPRSDVAPPCSRVC